LVYYSTMFLDSGLVWSVLKVRFDMSSLRLVGDKHKREERSDVFGQSVVSEFALGLSASRDLELGTFLAIDREQVLRTGHVCQCSGHSTHEVLILLDGITSTLVFDHFGRTRVPSDIRAAHSCVTFILIIGDRGIDLVDRRQELVVAALLVFLGTQHLLVHTRTLLQELSPIGVVLFAELGQSACDLVEDQVH